MTFDRMSKRHVGIIGFLALWVLKMALGLGDYFVRKVPDYPDAVRAKPYIGQFGLYVGVPAIFLALNLVMLAFARRMPRWLVAALLLLQVLSFLILVLLGSGGI